MSFSPSDLLVHLFSRDPDDLHSFGLLSSGQNNLWVARNATVNEEIQDLMVDVAAIFAPLPTLLDDHAVATKWNSAFESLFGLVKDLRPVMESEDAAPSRQFEGRQDRFYLPIEAEYFLTCFFHEFYEMLVRSDKLGSHHVELAWAEPTDDLFAIYRLVRESRTKQPGQHLRRKSNQRRSGSSGHRPSIISELEGTKIADDEVSEHIKRYLDDLVSAGSVSDKSAQNLMTIARAIDAHGDSSVHRFFLSFRRREFFKVYAPVQGSVNGEILIEVLSKYYFEYVADPRLFNAPSYETIVKDIMRDPRCEN